MKLMQWTIRISDGVDRAARVVAALFVAAMSVILILQVFFRFVLFNSLPWSEEASRYLFVWVSMLGASIALRLGWHPGLSLVTDRIPARMRAGAAAVANMLVLVLLFVVIREGYALGLMNASQRSPAMAIPMVYPYAAIWVGAIFMAVHVVRFLLAAVLELTGRSVQGIPEARLGAGAEVRPDALPGHSAGEEHVL